MGESPMWVKGLTGMADVMILIMVLAFLVKFIVEKQKERKFTMLFNAMLFIGFIALNIASSSVTIRVENALDLRILSWCITFPFLHLWGTDRRSKKRNCI